MGSQEAFLANFLDMPSGASTMGEHLVRRLHAAMNAHDIEAFVACFAEDYDSAQPTHPDRAFRGSEQVRENWSAVFTGVPDFRADLVRVTAAGDTAWSEWRWEGTQTDGGRLDMAGVIILGVRDDHVAWARLYVEPVQQTGAGIDAAVRDMTAER
jgi:ketosteroid isomerase-like protein